MQALYWVSQGWSLLRLGHSRPASRDPRSHHSLDQFPCGVYANRVLLRAILYGLAGRAVKILHFTPSN